MPTDKPRISFALSEELLRQVDEYRFSHRVKNQSQAIIQLMEKGLEVLMSQPAPETPTDDLTEQERNLIMDFRSLSPQGKAYVLQSVAMSVQIYKNEYLSVPNVENRG